MNQAIAEDENNLDQPPRIGRCHEPQRRRVGAVLLSVIHQEQSALVFKALLYFAARDVVLGLEFFQDCIRDTKVLHLLWMLITAHLTPFVYTNKSTKAKTRRSGRAGWVGARAVQAIGAALQPGVSGSQS